MAAILHDNRTLTFGANFDLHVSEKDLAEWISEKADVDEDDAIALVAELIDALEESINPA